MIPGRWHIVMRLDDNLCFNSALFMTMNQGLSGKHGLKGNLIKDDFQPQLNPNAPGIPPQVEGREVESRCRGYCNGFNTELYFHGYHSRALTLTACKSLRESVQVHSRETGEIERQELPNQREGDQERWRERLGETARWIGHLERQGGDRET